MHENSECDFGGVYLSGHPQSVTHLHLTADLTAWTGHPLPLHLALLHIHHTVVPTQHTQHTDITTHTLIPGALDKTPEDIVTLSICYSLGLTFLFMPCIWSCYDNVLLSLSLLRCGDPAALLEPLHMGEHYSDTAIYLTTLSEVLSWR